ncbi:hypothetical protein [Streptomyces sp. NPDC014623]|uniref:hypothetical protein n=1 Tax=Streptomyces sp. NPDC014623 TaxID=3364875 RepID=UPI0036F67D6A
MDEVLVAADLLKVEADLVTDLVDGVPRSTSRSNQSVTSARFYLVFDVLRAPGTPEQAEPREGDEAVRGELTRRVGSYAQSDVNGQLARALAARLGHYRDPAAREKAAGVVRLIECSRA